MECVVLPILISLFGILSTANANIFIFKGSWPPDEKLILEDMIEELLQHPKAGNFFVRLGKIKKKKPIFLYRKTKFKTAAAKATDSTIVFYDLFFDLTEFSEKKSNNEHLRILFHEILHCFDFNHPRLPLSHDKKFLALLNFKDSETFAKLPAKLSRQLIDKYLNLRQNGDFKLAVKFNFDSGRKFGLQTIYSAQNIREAFADYGSLMLFPKGAQPMNRRIKKWFRKNTGL